MISCLAFVQHRISLGCDGGTWWHKSFVRGSPFELKHIVRLQAGVKSKTSCSPDNMIEKTLNIEEVGSSNSMNLKNEVMSASGVGFDARPPVEKAASNVFDCLVSNFLEEFSQENNHTLRGESLISPKAVESKAEDFNVDEFRPLSISSSGKLNGNPDNDTSWYWRDLANAPVLGPSEGLFLRQANSTGVGTNLCVPHNVSSSSMACFPTNVMEQKIGRFDCPPQNSSVRNLDPLPLNCDSPDMAASDDFSIFVAKMIQLA